ncbi:hypothetical protein NOR51B_1389 [Luminiphilus syltensis NOR5-1B]|uniref:SnoaL-like domain-containing protein n=1 Tax=Luminiphilus syltensis NOR5-1B TaxID=565045 RepID=B8KV68_9GAMM|nr:nuclear transport factor 2 family protein [Luminiphilus syltensis]EED35444.1 hypothetical protein NOR51B_1389 [Luminiphilus syltensis NOR5-1B]
MERELQELLDKKACEEVLMRYARTLDWLDREGQASCFWPDADIDYGFYSGDGTGWVETVMEVELAAPRRWHMSGGALIRIEGAKAQSECYGFTVSMSTDDDGNSVDSLFGGRYLDELEKRGGQWRISKRRYILDFSYQLPNGLEDLVKSGFSLHTLQIQQPGHPDYREL